MPKLKPFKQFFQPRKKEEFLSSPANLLLGNISPSVKQQQPSAINVQKPTPSIQDNPPRATKATQTYEQEDGMTHKYTVSNLKNIKTCKPNETITKQLISRSRRPKNGFQIKQKKRRHQHRLCYRCKHTRHFIKDCPIIAENRRNQMAS